VYSSCNFDHTLSVGAIRFGDNRFCASVGGHSHDLPCTWRLSWLAVEKPWLAMARLFLSLLTQMGILLCLFRGSISGVVDSF